MSENNTQQPSYNIQSSSGDQLQQQQYVNFNQFLNQYNPNPNYEMGSLYYLPESTSFDGVRANHQIPPPVIEHSTLVPTAAEFVPSWVGDQSILPHQPNHYAASYESTRVSNAIPIEDPDPETISMTVADGDNATDRSYQNHQGAIKKSSSNHHKNNRYGPRFGNGVGEGSSNGNRTNSPRHYNNAGGSDYYNTRYNNGNYSSSKYKEYKDTRHWDRNGVDRNGGEGNNGGGGGFARKNDRDYRNDHYRGGADRRNDGGKQSSNAAMPLESKKAISVDENSKYTQRDKLSIEIDSGKLECLVCCDFIKTTHTIWSCHNCFHVLHLSCTMKWAISSKTEDGGWRCPACQNITKRVPRDYFCFCGKTKNPHYNRNDLAHSCGELCARKEQCEHSCTQLCHPGPCPPCQATVTRSCGCGQTTRMMQCNQKDELKCEQLCDKVLNCELHKCPEKCHLGECTVCPEKLVHKCYCAKAEREVECSRENRETMKYSCTKVCNRLLACRNHRCIQICHDGECGECKQSPVSKFSP